MSQNIWNCCGQCLSIVHAAHKNSKKIKKLKMPSIELAYRVLCSLFNMYVCFFLSYYFSRLARETISKHRETKWERNKKYNEEETHVQLFTNNTKRRLSTRVLLDGRRTKKKKKKRKMMIKKLLEYVSYVFCIM